MIRYIYLKDMFETKCKTCSSTDVDLSVNECSICGNSIIAECNSCGTKYEPHDFAKMKDNK